MTASHGSSRRAFLKKTAVLGAAVAAPYILPARVFGQADAVDGPAPGPVVVGPQGASAANRVNVCSIGVKNMGGGHLKTLLGRGDARVVAICDVDQNVRDAAVASATKAYGGNYTKGYNDYREALARPDIDAVVIAVPDHSHAYLTVAALKAGKDVYIEKPFSLTIYEGRVMVDTAKRYGRVFQCGSQRRSGEKQRRAVELVRNGRIGKLQRVEVGVGRRPVKAEYDSAPQPVPPELDYDFWLGPAPPAPYTKNRCHYNFRFIRDYSGGEMTNFGHHFLDVAQWGMGADDTGPVEIEGKGFFFPDGLYDTFADADIWYTYADGVKVHCTSGPQGIKFYGSDGWIDAESLACEPKNIASSVIGAGEIQIPKFKDSHLGSFLTAVRTRGPYPAPGAVGHRSATVCHLGNIAMTLERKLKWDPAKEQFVGDEEANRMLHRPYRSGWSLEHGKLG